MPVAAPPGLAAAIAPASPAIVAARRTASGSIFSSFTNAAAASTVAQLQEERVLTAHLRDTERRAYEEVAEHAAALRSDLRVAQGQLAEHQQAVRALQAELKDLGHRLHRNAPSNEAERAAGGTHKDQMAAKVIHALAKQAPTTPAGPIVAVRRGAPHIPSQARRCDIGGPATPSAEQVWACAVCAPPPPR